MLLGWWLIALRLLFGCRLVTASDVESSEIHPQVITKLMSPQTKTSMLLSMPIDQAITSRSKVQDDLLFAQAMDHRIEFHNINWKNEDFMELAEQLHSFRSDHADFHYHLELTNTFKLLMHFHGLSQTSMDTIMGLFQKRANTSRKQRSDRIKVAQNIIKSEQQKERRRERNTELIRRKREAKKMGSDWPLLSYIAFEHPERCDPQLLHEEALKYKNKYPSAHAFLMNLKSMLQTLGIDEGRVFRFNQDKRNLTDPS